MDLAADIGELDGADRLQPLGQRHEGSRRRPTGWWATLPAGHPPAGLDDQQSVQLLALNVRDGGGQPDKHEPLSSTTRLPGQPLDRRQGRRQDLPLTLFVDDRTHEDRPDIGAEGTRQ